MSSLVPNNKPIARYYTGEKVAPLLTVVIGGNHEASNYLWELWATLRIFFVGVSHCSMIGTTEDGWHPTSIILVVLGVFASTA